MSKRWSVWCSVWLCCRVFAQVPPHTLHVEGTGSYDSNVLSNALVGRLYKGGELGRDLRQKVADDLHASNRAGYLLSGDLWYAWSDSVAGRPWSWRIGVGHRSLLGLRFTPDVYRLAFFGNAAYQDAVAELGPSAFEQVDYQRIGFGAGRPDRWMVRVDLVNGSRLQAGSIRRADLYTAPSGEYLAVDLDGRYWRNDTTGNSGPQRGLGAALSAEWTFLRWGAEQRNPLTVSLEDLGFIAWNAQSLSVRSNERIMYEGFRVDDVLDLDGLVIGRQALQDTLGLGYTAGGFIRPLPFRTMLRTAWGDGEEQRTYEAFAEWRYLPGYLPYVGVVRRFRPEGACLRPEVQLTYGGFGGVRLGAGLTGALGEHVLLRLRLPNLVGLVVNDAPGQAVAFALDVRW